MTRSRTARSGATLAVAVCASVAAGAEVPPPATSRVPPRVAVHLGGMLSLASPGYDVTRTYEEYAETARLDGRLDAGRGPGMDLGVFVRVRPRLAASLGLSLARRNADGVFQARLPHPLYLGRDRVQTVPATAASERETGLHLGLAYVRAGRRLTTRLFAGPSFVWAAAALPDRVRYTHQYPYDEVVVHEVDMTTDRRSALGGHVGASVERAFNGSIGLAAQARFSRARVSFAGESVTGGGERSADLYAGGVDLGLGVRVFF